MQIFLKLKDVEISLISLVDGVIIPYGMSYW